MKRIFNTLILVSIMQNLTVAQQADTASYSFTLQQAIAYTYEHQANLLNARLDEMAAKHTVKDYTGIGLPQINSSIEFIDNVQLPTQFFPDFLSPSVYGILYDEGLISSIPDQNNQQFPVKFGTRYNTTAGISASQLIFDGTYIVGLKAAKTYRELTTRSTLVTQAEIAEKVSKAYYDVLINNERMELLNTNITRLKKLSDDTRAMYDNGFVEKIDADRVELAFNTMVTEKEKTERLIQLGYLLLKFQMGMDLSAKLTLTDKLNDMKLETTGLVNETFDFSRRPEFSVLQTNQKLQHLLVKKERFGYLPSLVAFGNLNTVASRNEFDVFDGSKPWFASGFIGAKLSMPIFDGLSRNARIQKNKIELAKVNNSMSQLKTGIQLEIASARVSLQNGLASLQTQKKNMELAGEISRVTRIKYEQGVGSNLEVVTAESALKEAQVGYLTALYDAMISKIDLDKATGNLK